jgi:hypothetical protein
MIERILIVFSNCNGFGWLRGIYLLGCNSWKKSGVEFGGLGGTGEIEQNPNFCKQKLGFLEKDVKFLT